MIILTVLLSSCGLKSLTISPSFSSNISATHFINFSWPLHLIPADAKAHIELLLIDRVTM